MLSGIPSRYGTSGYEFKSLVDFSHFLTNNSNNLRQVTEVPFLNNTYKHF